MFPVIDADGNEINISETEEDYIVLVPEKYDDMEKEIRLYFEQIKNGSSLSENQVLNQEIEVIWIRNNQKMFSCQLDVGIDDYNTIENPIIRVLTEQNGALEEYSNVLGSVDCPFKIKVKDGKDSQAEIDAVVGKYFDLVFNSIR